jgi:hypothetical protein
LQGQNKVMDAVQAIKHFLKNTWLYTFYKIRKDKKLYNIWLQSGKSAPPPHLVKQMVIKEYFEKFKTPIFIETGTYLGDMVYAVKDIFDCIYSVELDVDLWRNACARFTKAKNIIIVHGDSGEMLGRILDSIAKPCLFWLDGHYSAGVTAKGELMTPIQKELTCIFSHPLSKHHIILIDDARLFTGENDYPSIQLLGDWILSVGLNNFEVKDDIIRIYK